VVALDDLIAGAGRRDQEEGGEVGLFAQQPEQPLEPTSHQLTPVAVDLDALDRLEISAALTIVAIVVSG